MRRVKVQLIIERECELPDNFTHEDLMKESKKIKKILDMGYHVEVKIIEPKD
jgi:hypothetical protein